MADDPAQARGLPRRVRRLRLPPGRALHGQRDVERLLQDAGIVRHRGKIEATINNAQRAVELTEEQSLAHFVWSYDDPKPLARDLKRRGWRFVGPTTVYAFMQAMGLVNDHLPGCDAREPCERERAAFVKP